jgi:hypothetical protein
MSRVYIVNDSGYDLSDATKYTNEPFIVLTRGRVPFEPSTAVEMAKKLKDFQPEDFLILSGTPGLAVLAASILYQTNKIKVLNILLYNKMQNKYLPRRINGRMTLGVLDG